MVRSLWQALEMVRQNSRQPPSLEKRLFSLKSYFSHSFFIEFQITSVCSFWEIDMFCEFGLLENGNVTLIWKEINSSNSIFFYCQKCNFNCQLLKRPSLFDIDIWMKLCYMTLVSSIYVDFKGNNSCIFLFKIIHYSKGWVNLFYT